MYIATDPIDSTGSKNKSRPRRSQYFDVIARPQKQDCILYAHACARIHIVLYCKYAHCIQAHTHTHTHIHTPCVRVYYERAGACLSVVFFKSVQVKTVHAPRHSPHTRGGNTSRSSRPVSPVHFPPRFPPTTTIVVRRLVYDGI